MPKIRFLERPNPAMIIRTPLKKRKTYEAIKKEKAEAKLRREVRKEAKNRQGIVIQRNRSGRAAATIRPVHPLILDKLIEYASLGMKNREVAKKAGIANEVFYKLLRDDREFQIRWAMAKQAALDVMEDEILEIADDLRKDMKNGRVDKEHINRSRLRIEVRKWLMKIRAPKKYGDKILESLPPGGKKVSFTMEFGNDAPENATTIDGEAKDMTQYDEADG